MIHPTCRDLVQVVVTLVGLVLCVGPATPQSGEATGGAGSAGTWTGSVGGAVVGQSATGSEGSFGTQTLLDEGFVLEVLDLNYYGRQGRQGGQAGRSEFTLRAWGFGGAEPAEHGRMELRLDRRWRFSLGYDRRESLFDLAESELALRSDRWEITRWRGKVTWDGWSRARLTLHLRRVERDGTVARPFFGLNELYPLRVDLDEVLSETSVRIESRGWPVKITFEQALANYSRRNRRAADGPLNLDGDDADLLASAATSRDDDYGVPTSHLVASYSGDRVEVVGQASWSPADLESGGSTSSAFDLDGGRVGRVEFIDELLGSATMDTVAGNLRLGLRLTPNWRLRLFGDYRDTATDAAVLGRRILRLANPQGDGFDLPGAIDEGTFFDVEDGGGRLELEWLRGDWSVYGGILTESREVGWRRGREEPTVSVDRDSDGTVLGVAFRSGRRLTASAELEQGDFERFVFRTDPETVDRLSLRLKADLGRGFRLTAQGRFEEAENPEAVSGLDRSSDGVALSLAWSSRDGETGFGLDLDQTELTTDTGLVLPGGGVGLSRYDLSLLTTGVHGRVALGPVRLQAAANRLEDTGDTWPVEAWTAQARATFAAPAGTEIALFGQLWEYDEGLATGDDFEVIRFGVAFHWRFQ